MRFCSCGYSQITFSCVDSVVLLKIIKLIYVISLLVAGSGAAWAEDIEIRTDAPVIDLLDVLIPDQDQKANTNRHQSRVTLINGDENTTIWRIATEMLKPATFEIYLSDGTGKTPVISARYPFSPTRTKASQGRLISSKPIVLEPGQRIELVALFDLAPTEENFPVRLLPEATFDSEYSATSYLHGSYLGACFIFFVFFIVFSNLLESRPAKYYAIYFMFLTLLASHSYGYTEPLFFGHITEFYFHLFRLLQAGFMLSYIMFATSFISAKERYPLFYKIVTGYVLLIAILSPVEIFTYDETFPFIVDALALVFLTIGAISVVLALKNRMSGAYYFTFGFIFLLISGVINYLASLPSNFIYNRQVDAFTLSVQLLDAFIFSAAIISQTRGLKKDRDDALHARVVATEEKLMVSEKLLVAEQERELASRTAEQHRAKLATTSHDLRQPLSSLKLALVDSQTLTPDVHAKLATGIEYLNSILSDTLQETTPAGPQVQSPVPSFPAANPTDVEPVALQLIFDNLQRMFASEAEEKGLELRVADTSLAVNTSVITIIRVMSNLVANAVKYTSSGAVLVGARRRGDKVAIQVWDTGCGLDERTLERVLHKYQRGANVETVEGLGLGLSIVQDLLQQQGLKLKVRSIPGRGSVFSVEGLAVAAIS